MRISIVTICFNNLSELIATIESVDNQTQKPYQHWIIDGSTNKDIQDWASKQVHPNYRSFIHEPDKGISDAFNKGILRCSGEIIHLLNSGDTYQDGSVLEKVSTAFEQNKKIDWLNGQYVQYRGDISVVSGCAFDAAQLWKGMRMVAHPTMFIKKAIYDAIGLYDENKKIAMDYDFLVRMRKYPSTYIAYPLVNFAPGGTSSVQFQQGLKEVKESHTKWIGHSWKMDLWQIRQRLLHWFMSTRIGVIWFQIKNRSKQSA